MQLHAEIAGAGFSGLALGSLLADRGWSVRIHERSDEVREIGAGIFLHNNGLLVLEEMNLMDGLKERGTELERERMLDAHGRVLQNRKLDGESRIWSFPREDLMGALHQAAVLRGVDIVTGSSIERAAPNGTLTDSDGNDFEGDLVVGADGHHSRVRKSTGLSTRESELPTTSIRFLLRGRDLAQDPVTTEHWSVHRRIALAACGPENTYVYMACPVADVSGSRVPLDYESWTERFPGLRDVFVRLHDESAFKSHYSLVTCRSWSQGRVALVGDAAHALAPTLGQGANLSLSNCRSLVSFLGSEADITSALTRWEEEVRGVTDATQRWAGLYDRATKHWPASLHLARAGVVWAFGASQYLNRRLRLADHTPPVVVEPSSNNRA